MGVRPPSSISRTSKQNATQQQGSRAQEQLFDTHPESSLDFEIVREAAREKYERPFLILDNSIVREKVRRFRAAMPRVRQHYAVKANPDRRVVKALMQEDCRFEIASTRSSTCCCRSGVNPAEVFYSNPMRSRESIAYAAGKGVEWYVVDSVDELRRVHEIKSDARMYLRIATPNIGSDWPLSGKFGAGTAETSEIVADRGETGRRPGRRDLPRRFAVPQSRKTGASASRRRARCSTR